MHSRALTTVCGLIFLSMSAKVLATEIRHCRLSGGRSFYSDGRCPKGSVELWVRAAGGEGRVLSEEARARLADTREWQRQNRAEVTAWVKTQAVAGGRRRRATQALDPCEQARARRDRRRDREFLTMTFDRAVALDNEVRDLCR